VTYCTECLFFYFHTIAIYIVDEDFVPGPEDDEDGENIFDEFGQSEKSIGAKKLRKLQDKAEKKRQREVI
jgi:hypothetical protein